MTIMIRIVNPLPTRQVEKLLKPRNPVLAALKASQGARGGLHRKKRGALRRAEKMAIAKAVANSDW